jgi:NAD(P)-dependent dehydrogenase (short-subunit alcohol dehydrogenase family)
MKVAGSIALVTGANRGLGLAFAKALVEMRAAKVYAAARNPQAVSLKGVVPLKLDVTSDEDVVCCSARGRRRQPARQQRGHRKAWRFSRRRGSRCRARAV